MRSRAVNRESCLYRLHCADHRYEGSGRGTTTTLVTYRVHGHIQVVSLYLHVDLARASTP
jgi:hypothetical protein